jgi:two-component system, cell cycle sensor histidine kinase PleC
VNLVPAFGNFDTVDTTPPGALVFVVDPDLGRLVEANASARQAWCVEVGPDGGGRLPVALDRAMPAWAELRAAPSWGVPSPVKRLTFWTRNGVAIWDCRLQAVVGPVADRVRITVVDPLGVWASVSSQVAEKAPVPGAAFDRLAHELRTPLAAIASLADVMAESRLGPLGNARYEDYARNISETARHALDVVATMLAPGSLGTSLPEQTFTDLDLSEIVTDVASSLRVMAEERGLALSVQLAPAMPRVIADRVSVQRIVLNFVRNGLEHAAGASRLVLRVGVTPAGEAWVEVEDDGPGIAAEVVTRLAHGEAPRGSRMEARPPGDASTGLGLVLARELAQANAARLEFLPVLPHGTRVRLRFDAARSVLV